MSAQHQPATQVTLDQLVPGQQALIVRITGERRLRHRLLEMGLLHGELITMRAVAPLGDPIELVVKGYRLSLRKDEARLIQVKLYQG